MRQRAVWLIALGIGLVGCHRATGPSSDSSKPDNRKLVADWFQMPPVSGINRQNTLIPVLRIGGNYYTTYRGLEIPLQKTPEGLKWNLLPSPLADTTIGYFGPSYPCSIRVVDRTRVNLDPSYSPDAAPPVLMTKANEPDGLLEATAAKPRKLDDFVGVYYPVWFPWFRLEIRKDGNQYLSVEQVLASLEPPLQWTPRGRAQMITPFADGLGFVGFPGDPHSLVYNETLKRFELVRADNGLKMPLAKLPPKKEITLPTLPIGIPTWN